MINTDEVVILTSNPGVEGFQQVGVNNLPPGPLIDRIEIDNSGGSGDVVVDDVSFLAPEPGGAGVVAAALAALALVGRGRRGGAAS